MRGRRVVRTALILILPALLLGLSGWPVIRKIRQDRRDRALIAAIKSDDPETAIQLLRQGADANAEDHPGSNLPLWQQLLQRMRGDREPSKPHPSALQT